MLIPPKYFLTPKITQLLQSIEGSREIVNTITIPPEIETNIRRQSVLKSSLFSARVEGNPLTLEELSKRFSKDQRKIEVYNILKTLNLIHQTGLKDLTVKQILKFHHVVMAGLSEKHDLGKFRQDI